jgi:hypothetical protein
MIFCPKCHSQLLEGAKFCHNCGTNIEIPLGDCNSCGKKNPADAQFCYSCGNPMGAIQMPRVYDGRSKYDFQQLDVLEEQIKTLFFEELKRLASWIAPDKIEEYLREFYFKNFTSTVARRAEQLAEEFAELNFRQAFPSVILLEKQLENAIGSLALYHIIYNCSAINPIEIPEKIMRYERAIRGKVDMKEMIFDYLNFQKERQKVFTDFVKMPFTTLQNAAKNYVFAAKDEFIYFIADQTLLGSGKEGFAMTEYAIYWKSPLEKPHKVYYHHLARLERHKTWITINGHFFSVNPSINTKMLLLLEKLKAIYSTN